MIHKNMQMEIILDLHILMEPEINNKPSTYTRLFMVIFTIEVWVSQHTCKGKLYYKL